MTTLTLLRAAASRSVRPPVHFASLTPVTSSSEFSVRWRRYYATENNSESNTKDEQAEANAKKDGEAAATSAENGEQLEDKDKKIAELKDLYLRCLADQENLRDRTRREVQQKEDFAIQKFAKDILDTVDILGLALSSVPKPLIEAEIASEQQPADISHAGALRDLYTGVSMTEAELLKTLKRYGVEQYNPEGEKFDPNLHQALFQAPMPEKEVGTVFSVQKVGYLIKGRVLRPAQVGVVSDASQQ